MGISLKDIFKSDEEKLVKDRRNVAIRNLVIFSVVIVILMIATIVWKNWGDKNEERRIAITKDAMNIQTTILSLAESNTVADEKEELPGISLENIDMKALTDKKATPAMQSLAKLIGNKSSVVIGGEEYRYGYYFLDNETLNSLQKALNISSKEEYIVNYDTGDVVNVSGVTYNKKKYYSINDMVAIQNGKTPPSDYAVIISKASDLNQIRKNPNGYYKLSANIDMSEFKTGEGWEPISSFKGVLDGREYTISNLVINRPTQSNVGLFGKVDEGANIVNLKIKDFNITGGKYTGVLAGYCSANISNIEIESGEVTGYEGSTGALIGAYAISEINNCKASAKVNGENEVGGVVGTLYSGKLKRVSFKGNVTATKDDVGGLVGNARVSANNVSITECVSRPKINGKSNLGGLIGEIEMTSVNTIEVENCYAIGSIDNGESNVGGMVGYIFYGALESPTINFNYSYVDVNIVNIVDTAGGFIGKSAVSTSTNRSSKMCYWKKDLKPGQKLEGTGEYTGGLELVSTALTPEQIVMRREFTDWDFVKVWDIMERTSSPFLRWEKK